MFVKDTDKNTQYKDGYTTGYTWMTQGWNFIHPYDTYTNGNQTLPGYIPGGPSIMVYSNSNDVGYRTEVALANAYRNAWRNGFIDGINKYVLENNLGFDQIPNV